MNNLTLISNVFVELIAAEFYSHVALRLYC